MIDERTRYFSIIKSNQNIPLNIYTDIVLHCMNHEYYELDVHKTDIVALKEEFSVLPTVQYVYYSIQWLDDKPQFMISICSSKKLNEEQVDKIFEYRITIKKVISFELEQTKYERLHE